MKKLLSIILSIVCILLFSQTKNKYGMSLYQKDGKYMIDRIDEINKIIDTTGLKDLYMTYHYKPKIIKESEYRNCKTLRVVYKEYKNYSLSMEIDIPLKVSKPTPFIIYVHGGGWKGGNLLSFKPYSSYLASNGIAGVRLEYSLKKNNGDFQQGLDEIEAAYKFIETRAKEWNLDMNRLGFAGGSAGAALASYWAMKLPNCKLFIGYNGIYNLTQSKPQGSFPGKDDIYLRNFKDDDSKKTISALFIIPEINPPAVLVVHGTGDVTISYDQSIALCNAIEKRGGVCRRLIYPYYQHAFCNINSSDKYEEILIESYKFAKAIFKN